MTVAPLLETPRLLLHALEPSDGTLIEALNGDPEVMLYVTGGRIHSRETVRKDVLPRMLAARQESGEPEYVVARERSTGASVGWFHLKAPGRGADASPGDQELGYRLLPAAWGQGYATEGGAALTRHAFEARAARRVVARVLEANAASRRVLEKLGMRVVRAFEEPTVHEGARGLVYAISAEEWQQADGQEG